MNCYIFVPHHQVKSVWSDKISQLESQISHLNTKMAEDSEEMATNQVGSGFKKNIYIHICDYLFRNLLLL